MILIEFTFHLSMASMTFIFSTIFHFYTIHSTRHDIHLPIDMLTLHFRVETGALGPMLSQLVVNLLPLLQELPKQTADILHYLIVDNK